ncbi:MAG: Hsp20/alpha crystallin family protein [Burkholderiales bacterium]|nr:Hsp20/alpha crystallin family protein [Burkholderiales bacterium]
MTALQVYDPFADAGFEDIFRNFFRPVREPRAGGVATAPIKLDVVDKNGTFVVRAEVPGVSKDDIHVTIDGNQVTITAEVKRESEQKEGERVLRSERYYGSVYRSFVLPVEIDQEGSQAKYENGVLELTLPKRPAVAGRKLAIK